MTNADGELCNEQQIEEEFALVHAAMPENAGLVLVAVAHDHGVHVMLENNLPISALVDLLNSVLQRESEATS